MLRESNATEDVPSPPPTPQLLGECLRQRQGLDCVERLIGATGLVRNTDF